MKARPSALVMAAVALLGVGATPVSGATIIIESPAAVQLNETFSVVVGMADVDDLYAYQLRFQFDASSFDLVPPTPIAEGPFLGSATEFILGDVSYADFPLGEVEVAASRLGMVPGVSTGPGVPGALLLVTLRAKALTDPFEFESGLLTVKDVLALSSVLDTIPVNDQFTNVSVVPEPAGLPFLALAAAFAVRRLQHYRRV